MAEDEHTVDRSSAAHLEHLLQPSLGKGLSVPALYSVQAGFLVAFLGGGFASVFFTALNSRKLNRLDKDMPWLVVGGLFFALVFGSYGYLGVSETELPMVGPLQENRFMLRQVARFLGLVFFGLAFLQHRRFYKAAEMNDTAVLNPWIPGIACALASSLAAIVSGMLGRGFA